MAYSGKSEQRAAASVNYGGASATLNSSSIKEPASMDNGSSKLYGHFTSKSRSSSLYGRQDSGSPSGVAGKLSGNGYPNGPKWKRAMEPGELKPGTRAQAKNTTRMTPGGDKKSATMKVTSTTPKALRGGR